MQNIGERKPSILALVCRCTALVALLFAFSFVARAQSTATLQGSVVDSSNAAVLNATVTIHNQGTGVDVTTKTDASGYYLAPGLLPGSYQVTVTASGFQSYIVKDLKLDVATTATQNAQLTVGQVTQEVVVSGGGPPLFYCVCVFSESPRSRSNCAQATDKTALPRLEPKY